jgi:hypothetical protein
LAVEDLRGRWDESRSATPEGREPSAVERSAAAVVGVIVAVCTSPVSGLPKYARPEARVGAFGLEGDFHNREFRKSYSPPWLPKPNVDRHVTVFAAEVYDDLNRQLGLELAPGAVAENIATRGLGDLSAIPDGALIRLGRDVVLRVVEQNQPCRKLRALHRACVKRVYGRRGLLCAIEHGHGATLRPGDPVVVLPG